MTGCLDRTRIAALMVRETSAFVAHRPRSTALLARAAQSMPNAVPMAWMRALYAHPPPFAGSGRGATFTDVDGHEYIDMNVGDMSMILGFAPPLVVDAVARGVANGAHFLLPQEDAITVSELLAARTGMGHWQYTLSASQANVEAIRLARVATGRERIVIFDGKYHGHV